MFLLFLALIWCSFVGNPISLIVTTLRVRIHIAQNYPDNDFSIPFAVYDFKSREYVIRVQSASSPDTSFLVSAGNGFTDPLRDEYQQSVASGYNTAMRIWRSIGTDIESLFERKLDYKDGFWDVSVDMMPVEMMPEDGEDVQWTLDMPYQHLQSPWPLHLRFRCDLGKVGWQQMADILVKLRTFTEEHDLPIAFYTVQLASIDVSDDVTEQGRWEHIIVVKEFPIELIADSADLAGLLPEWGYSTRSKMRD